MKFSEIVDQASALLQQKGRSTYRALKLEFGLNDEQLEALRDELLFAYQEILDEAGRGLVWVGVPPVQVQGSRFQVETPNSELRTPNCPP
jgi:hypothetical protein